MIYSRPSRGLFIAPYSKPSRHQITVLIIISNESKIILPFSISEPKMQFKKTIGSITIIRHLCCRNISLNVPGQTDCGVCESLGGNIENRSIEYDFFI